MLTSFLELEYNFDQFLSFIIFTSNFYYFLGCGKTMLAKAVAHHTTASFIRVVGSEFVQKYLGEGPRMVRSNTISIKIMSSHFNPLIVVAVLNMHV
jgi:AAA+ superfamily predicted ATPase